MSLPFTPGQDVVGTLVSLPKSNTSSTALPALEIGQTVMSPINNAFAEYAVAPWWKVAPIPKGVEPKLGVPAATTALTMAYLVKESYEVKKGDWILVRAAAGGVGLLLCQVSIHSLMWIEVEPVQICAYKGANVIATVSTPEKADLAKQNGAHHVLLTTTPSAENVKAIQDLTDGKGVHAVYDGVGKDTFDEDFEVVRSRGTLVMYGNASVRPFQFSGSVSILIRKGAPAEFSVLRLSPKSLKITRPTLGAFIGNPEDFAAYAQEVLDWMKDGHLNVSFDLRQDRGTNAQFTIHKEYPFTAEGVSQSQIDISSRGTVGKLLIKVSD